MVDKRRQPPHPLTGRHVAVSRVFRSPVAEPEPDKTIVDDAGGVFGGAASPRPRARHHEPADELVATSATLWHGVPDTPEQPDAVDVAEAYTLPRRRGPWRWLAVGAGVAGLGAALAFVFAGSAEAPQMPEVRVVTVSVGDQAGDRTVRDEQAAAAGAEAARDEAKADRAEAAEAHAADAEAPVVAVAPRAPPAWVAAVASSNPWVPVAGADGEVRLGLAQGAMKRGVAASLTGFRPARQAMAPRAGFALQTHEVTWAELELAVGTLVGLEDLSRPPWVPKAAAARAELPATGVPWHLAQAFCEAMGGDLPSEAQWEWAARGPERRPFPWGDEALDSRHVHFLATGRVPVVAVGTSRQDRTPGDPALVDMLANAREWTRDAWTPPEVAAPDANRLSPVPRGPAKLLAPVRAARRGSQKPQPTDDMARAVRGWPLRRPGKPIPAEGATYRQRICVSGACAAPPDITRIGFRCARAAAP